MTLARVRLVVLAAVAVMMLGSVATAATVDPPANDDMSNAIEAGSLPFLTSGSNVGATPEKFENTGCNSPAEYSVWYSYTATATEMVFYEASSSEFNPRIWTFKGTDPAGPGDLTPIQYCGQSNGVLDVLAGTTYYFMISAYEWDSTLFGDFTFAINPVSNDDFAGAYELSGLPIHVRGVNYVNYGDADAERAIPVSSVGLEEGEPQPCGNIGATVWYRYASTVDAPMTANTFDVSGDGVFLFDAAPRTSFDTVLAVYSGPADATFADLTLLGCNDDTGQGASRVDFDAATGTTYYFQVGGFNVQSNGPRNDSRSLSGPIGIFDLTVSALCKGRPATIVGTNGGDEIFGTGGRDVIAGLGGADLIIARGGSDIVCGGPGDDDLRGGAGNDRLFGQTGTDEAFGGRGKKDICLAETTSSCIPR